MTVATFLRYFHATMTFLWIASTVPILLIQGLKTSITLLVFISIWANAAGHFAAWQATRIESQPCRHCGCAP